MAAYIHNIATAVPEHSYEQDFLRDKMKQYVGKQSASKRIIHRIYSKSGINKRHTVINDFHKNGAARFFFEKDGSLNTPSTGQRNELYTEKAKSLFVETARKTIRQNEAITKDDITHIITVSCTGFFAPEPGFEIIKQLGLPHTTQRFHLGFMGCFAAFPAMQMAQSFTTADSTANVLVICLELCSIHLQDSESTDNLISASVFADGAAGILINSHKPSNGGFRINQFSTAIIDESEQDMAWSIGDTGFDMVLSTYVPHLIESNLNTALQPLFEDYQLSANQIHHWAIHPGGRAILDKIEQSFSLEPHQLLASRKVLANYGNMSSATILFVLHQLLKQSPGKESEQVLAMAFGPGLTMESGLLTKMPNTI